MPVRKAKRILARTTSASGVLRAAEMLERARLGNRYIRVLNMHGTPRREANQFRQQVRYLSQRYAPVNEQDLAALLDSGTWHKQKPGLILSFDDGLRSNIDTALPIVEEHGLVAWFFTPVAFIDTVPEEQAAFARDHRITVDDTFADARVAVSWDELRAISSHHVIGCHTLTHRRLGLPISEQELADEIVHSKATLEQRLGQTVNSFCWVGGEEVSYSREAALTVAAAGYRFSFMTNNEPITPHTHPLQLQRTNIESDWPLDVVRFQVSGLLDAMYAGKRARVNALTHTTPTNNSFLRQSANA